MRWAYFDLSDSNEKTRWFVQEVHAHDSSLRAYLRGMFPKVRDVDDVVQESYVRVWKAQAATPIRSGRGFLFRVARHLALDWLRHEKASPIEEVTDLAALSVSEERRDVGESASVQEETSLLLEAIDQLPSRCREILILRKLKGVPQKEIAARLGISEMTVQVQIGRGLRKCEQYLRRNGVSR
jgi:RNA polymerase sigma factor (sigma-70 family)